MFPWSNLLARYAITMQRFSQSSTGPPCALIHNLRLQLQLHLLMKVIPRIVIYWWCTDGRLFFLPRTWSFEFDNCSYTAWKWLEKGSFCVLGAQLTSGRWQWSMQPSTLTPRWYRADGNVMPYTKFVTAVGTLSSCQKTKEYNQKDRQKARNKRL